MCWPCTEKLGCRIRKLNIKEKRLGGKGKLTNAIIDKLQNNYCIAIRQNKDNIQSAVKATLFHVLLDQRIVIISPQGEDVLTT